MGFASPACPGLSNKNRSAEKNELFFYFFLYLKQLDQTEASSRKLCFKRASLNLLKDPKDSLLGSLKFCKVP